MKRCEIIIYWSAEDQAFVAKVSELPGCMAYGASYEEILANVQEAMEFWLDTARRQGEPAPLPMTRRLIST